MSLQPGKACGNDASIIRTVFDNAVSRGEFPRHADPSAVVETLVAPLYFRLLITGGPLENWPTNEMIDRMLAAYVVRPQAGRTHNRGRPRRPNKT